MHGRYRLRGFYQHFAVQGFVAALIFGSFVANIIQTELGDDSGRGDIFAAIEVDILFLQRCRYNDDDGDDDDTDTKNNTITKTKISVRYLRRNRC